MENLKHSITYGRIEIKHQHLRIKYPQFLNCCKFINTYLGLNGASGIHVIEKIEDLAYGTQDSKKFLPQLIDSNGVLCDNLCKKFLHFLIEEYKIPTSIEVFEYNNKGKTITEEMVENYLIKLKKKHNLNIHQIKTALLKINLKVFLKLLNSKNILIENGEIIDINDPILNNLKLTF